MIVTSLAKFFEHMDRNSECLTWYLLQQKLPPHIPSTIPFLGQAISFGQDPVQFLLAAYDKVRLPL